MAVQKDTLFERFLAPVFSTFLIDRNAIQQHRQQVDWEAESDRFRQPNLTYPAYYESQNFHGITGGYLTVDAAVTYDPITQHVIPPNEQWVRDELLKRVQGHPQRILDLGCGTGSTTLLLKKAFPKARVTGLDLSPYMLVVADQKAQAAGLDIQWHHGNAEHSPFPDGSVDLITLSLLFHELPPLISCNVLQECFRLLKAGGELLILDGHQGMLRQTPWLTEVFEEPYIKDYAAGSIDDWMSTAGFGDVQTDQIWMIHQVSRGVKPLPHTASVRAVNFAEVEMGGDRQWVPG